VRWRVISAAALALLASEILLRLIGIPKKHDLSGSCDVRLSEPDARYGWVWKPAHHDTRNQAGRVVEYAFDAERHRAPSADAKPDHARPSILFVGESIIEGYGLDWPETLPAIVSSALDVQPVVLGVDGYASDQAFARFYDTLPQYEHVVAVVTLFFPRLVDRVAWVDHPRLSFEQGEPKVLPGPPGFWSNLRVTRVARETWPWRDAGAVRLTGQVFRETARLAEARGARALFLATHTREGWSRADADLVDTLLVKPGLDVLELGFDPINDYVHPTPASTRTMAEAVVAALRGERQPFRPRTR
jgi:hypothetical protein